MVDKWDGYRKYIAKAILNGYRVYSTTIPWSLFMTKLSVYKNVSIQHIHHVMYSNFSLDKIYGYTTSHALIACKIDFTVSYIYS